MYRYMLLFLLFAHIQAADDEKLIDARKQQLELVRQQSQWDNEHRFVYKQEYNGSVVDDSLPEDWESRWWKLPLVGIRAVMQDHNALSEVSYFRNLGASILNDKKKLSKERVLTPFFDQLAGKQQEEKDTVLKRLLKKMPDRDYPVGRLLFAALLHIGANVKVLEGKGDDLLATVLLKDDTPLVDLALQKGADPNQRAYLAKRGSSVLSYCNSLEAGELMVKYGAKITEASWDRKDLVYGACFRGKLKVLPFCLNHIPPSESNGFGSAWMKALAQNGHLSVMVEQVEILLGYGCQYDEETKNKICERVAQGSPELKERIERAFANAEIKKDIKG